jgi:hypothetical protein
MMNHPLTIRAHPLITGSILGLIAKMMQLTQKERIVMLQALQLYSLTMAMIPLLTPHLNQAFK